MRHRLAAAVLLCPALLSAQEDQGPYAMRYGPALTATVDCGGRSGTTLKGLVVRCGDRGTAVFDTELLRLSAAWVDGWLRLRGTAYDASHGPMPSRRGRSLVETVPGPGWAQDGSFVDPRPIPYGPLPREWGNFTGYRLCGDDVVVCYRVGDMDVREGYAIEGDAPCIVARTLELGPSTSGQQMVVFDGPEAAECGAWGGGGGPYYAFVSWLPRPPVEVDATTKEWSSLAIGGPSAGDYLDASSGTGARITAVPGFCRVHAARDAADARVALLNDGAAAANDDDVQRSVWFDTRKVGGDEREDGRYLVDLRRIVAVSRVSTFSWHKAERSPQHYTLFGSDAEVSPDAAAADPATAGWTEIAKVDTRGLGDGDKHGASIWRPDGLGRFHHLLFVVDRGGTFFSEIDVFADRFAAPQDQTPREQRCVAVALRGAGGPELHLDGPVLRVAGRRVVLDVPAHAQPLRVQLRMVAGATVEQGAAAIAANGDDRVAPLSTLPAAARWGAPLVTKGYRAPDDGAFAVDTITIPLDNPFHSRMRTAAFDFFRDGRAAVSTWNGDVWIVDGIDDGLDELQWRRFATGLFDPLGLRIVDDVVHVLGRDGITRLNDENGDGEADWFECFNHDVLITSAFHEFAFDLQTDAEGNFYFSKGAPVKPGGRGFMKIVPHHGTILKVSKDGAHIETVATGLRAPNGIGVSETGIVTSGDNEGTYMPRCRLNWITQPGFYGGVVDTAHRTPVPAAPDLPLCWMPMDVDNSSGGQVWVTGAGWPDLAGRLLHLSYGTCSVFLVLTEEVDGHMQGGVVRLPAEFSSSCMRGRFSPRDGELYVIGLQGWQTSAAREGGFHRVRRTKAPLGLPVALRTCTKGVYLTFAEPLDEATATDLDSFGVEVWNYRYSPNYGSPEVSVLHPEREVAEGKPNRDPLPVTAARLSKDRRTVFLAVSGMRPVHQMRVTWNVDAADGRAMKGELHNTIHALAPDPGFPER